MSTSAPVHALTCWLRARWRRYRYHQPFWRDDKTASMLGGINRFGCPRCGRGAAAEREHMFGGNPYPSDGSELL